MWSADDTRSKRAFLSADVALTKCVIFLRGCHQVEVCHFYADDTLTKCAFLSAEVAPSHDPQSLKPGVAA
jgi:hypothetical protein